MHLERDEFVITYDATNATVEELVRVSTETGFEASVVPSADSTTPNIETSFEEALARARNENKPVVLDFTASWCAPCQRMLKETFPDPKVAALLERCVLVKIDTDEQPELAKRFGVVGLPDIRFLSPDGIETRNLLDFQGPDAFAQALDQLLAGVAAGEASDKLIALSDGERELKEAFNRDVGNVRLVLVLSPT